MATAQIIKKDGRTLYRVQIRRPTKGIKVDKYFSKKREADAFIREVEHAIQSGRPITENVQVRKSFSEALTAYLEDPESFKTPKGRELKPSARKDREWRLNWLKRECFGDVVLKSLTWELIDQKLKEQSQARNWSPATRYRYETTISRFLEYCRQHGWAAHNVMADQQRLNDSGKRERVYTDKEWQALLEAADGQGGVLGMFLRLAWETGARRSELLNLRWVEVEPVESDRLGGKIYLSDTKNREPRVTFISKATYGLLQAHEQQFRQDASPLVFPSRTRDGRYSKISVLFREARAQAGLDQPDEKYGEVLSIHHIRHSWATRLGDSGATLASAKNPNQRRQQFC
jgi:integrase